MDYSKELRKIRITLIFLTIVMFFSIGNRNDFTDSNIAVDIPETIQVEHPFESDTPSMINLGNGNIGVYNSYSENIDGPSLVIYHYDEKTKKLILQTEQAIRVDE